MHMVSVSGLRKRDETNCTKTPNPHAVGPKTSPVPKNKVILGIVLWRPSFARHWTFVLQQRGFISLSLSLFFYRFSHSPRLVGCFCFSFSPFLPLLQGRIRSGFGPTIIREEYNNFIGVLVVFSSRVLREK